MDSNQTSVQKKQIHYDLSNSVLPEAPMKEAIGYNSFGFSDRLRKSVSTLLLGTLGFSGVPSRLQGQERESSNPSSLTGGGSNDQVYDFNKPLDYSYSLPSLPLLYESYSYSPAVTLSPAGPLGLAKYRDSLAKESRQDIYVDARILKHLAVMKNDPASFTALSYALEAARPWVKAAPFFKSTGNPPHYEFSLKDPEAFARNVNEVRKAADFIYKSYAQNSDGKQFGEWLEENVTAIASSAPVAAGTSSNPIAAGIGLLLASTSGYETLKTTYYDQLARNLNSHINPISEANSMRMFIDTITLLHLEPAFGKSIDASIEYPYSSTPVGRIAADHPEIRDIFEIEFERELKEADPGYREQQVYKFCAEEDQKYSILIKEVQDLLRQNQLNSEKIQELTDNYKKLIDEIYSAANDNPNNINSSDDDEMTLAQVRDTVKMGHHMLNLAGSLGPDDPDFQVAIAAGHAALTIGGALKTIALQTGSGAVSGATASAGNPYITAAGAVVGFVMAVIQIEQNHRAAKAEHRFKKALIKSIQDLREELRFQFKEINQALVNQSSLTRGQIQNLQLSVNRGFGQVFFELEKLSSFAQSSQQENRERLHLIYDQQRSIWDALRINRRLSADLQKENIYIEEISAIQALNRSDRLHLPYKLTPEALTETHGELSFEEYGKAMDVFLNGATFRSRGPAASSGAKEDAVGILASRDFDNLVASDDLYALFSYLEQSGIGKGFGGVPIRGGTGVFDDGIKAGLFGRPVNLGWWMRNVDHYLHFAERQATLTSPNYGIYAEYYRRHDIDLSKLGDLIKEGYRIRYDLDRLLPIGSDGKVQTHKLGPLFLKYEEALDAAIRGLGRYNYRVVSRSEYSDLNFQSPIEEQPATTRMANISLRNFQQEGILPALSYGNVGTQDPEYTLQVLTALKVRNQKEFIKLIPEHYHKACYLFGGTIDINYKDIKTVDNHVQLTIEASVNLGVHGDYRIFRYTLEDKEPERTIGSGLSSERLLSDTVQYWNTSPHLEEILLTAPNNLANEISEEELTLAKTVLDSFMNEALAREDAVLKANRQSELDFATGLLEELEASRKAIQYTLSLFYSDKVTLGHLNGLPGRADLLRGYAKDGKVSRNDLNKQTTASLIKYLSEEAPIEERTSVDMIDSLLARAESLYDKKLAEHRSSPDGIGIQKIDFSDGRKPSWESIAAALSQLEKLATSSPESPEAQQNK